MTNLEKLNENLQKLIERHTAAIEKNCSEIVKNYLKEHNEGGTYIKFIKHQPIEYKVSDYHYLLYEAPSINIELRHDIDSLLCEFKIQRDPEFFKSFPGQGVKCQGFMAMPSEDWVKNYMNEEYVEPEPKKRYDGPNPFYWLDWKCSDEDFDKRYQHFNAVMEKFINKN